MIRLRPCAWCAEFFTSTQTTDPLDYSLSENILLDVIVSVIKLHRLLCLELKSMKTSLILTVGLCAASAVSAVTYPDSFKNCPKDHYASGSLEKCEDQKLVYGKLNYPAKEKDNEGLVEKGQASGFVLKRLTTCAQAFTARRNPNRDVRRRTRYLRERGRTALYAGRSPQR